MTEETCYHPNIYNYILIFSYGWSSSHGLNDKIRNKEKDWVHQSGCEPFETEKCPEYCLSLLFIKLVDKRFKNT